ncbi:MAG: hypothetical protein OXJ54_16900 [Gemmatimonadetes bacterium]|nr:hypothetical protein [Candidatus Palauibacter rhopaloidicola]
MAAARDRGAPRTTRDGTETWTLEARHDLIDCAAAERWLRYRDNLDVTTRNYGEDFAEATLKLLPGFIDDARALADMMGRKQVVVAGGGHASA